MRPLTHFRWVGILQGKCRKSLERCMSDTTQDTATKPPSAIPGPKPWPIVGTIPYHRPGAELHSEHHRRLGFTIYKKYGPVAREMLLPNRPMTHVFHPEDIETVLRNDDTHPWRMTREILLHYRKKKGISIGIATLQGEEWFRIRSQAQTQMLRPRTVASYLPEQALIADDLVKRIRALRDDRNDIHDFFSELGKWAMESIGVVCFNTRVGALEPDHTSTEEGRRFVEAVKGIFKAMNDIFLAFPLYKIIPTKSWRKFTEDMDFVFNLSQKYMDLTEARAARGEMGGEAGKENLLISLLNRPHLSRDEAYVMVADLFFGGIDTVSNLATFCLYQLATNPHVQKKLQEEIDEKLPRGDPLTEKAFDQMPYLKAVVKETSRLSPVPNGLTRKLSKDIVIKGYTVPAGDMIVMWCSVASMLPEYFEDPETFLPERWLRGPQRNSIHPFATLPFGFGPRMCIGRRFAEQEIYLAITKLLQEFRLEYHDVMEVKTLTINTPAKPFKLRFIDREDT